VTSILVRSVERLDGVDPARVWAFVADPANIVRWAPARTIGYLGTEIPDVGHSLFLHRGRRERAGRAWRCRIAQWEAGHRIRCTLDTPGAARQQEIEVVVETSGSGAAPAADLSLAYRAEVPAPAALLYRWRIAAMERTALRKIREEVGAP